MPQSPFDLNHQYQLYLQRVGLKESTMHSQQKRETKRAFMGACGILLILFKEEFPKMKEAQAVDALQSMINQVGQFFTDEITNSN
jgi:hypothetical protein